MEEDENMKKNSRNQRKSLRGQIRKPMGNVNEIIMRQPYTF